MDKMMADEINKFHAEVTQIILARLRGKVISPDRQLVSGVEISLYEMLQDLIIAEDNIKYNK